MNYLKYLSLFFVFLMGIPNNYLCAKEYVEERIPTNSILLYEIFDLAVEEKNNDGIFQFGEEITVTFSIRNISQKELNSIPGNPKIIEGEQCIEFSAPWAAWNEEKGERSRWRREKIPPGGTWKVQWNLIVNYCFEKSDFKFGYNLMGSKISLPDIEYKVSRFFDNEMEFCTNEEFSSYEFTEPFEQYLSTLRSNSVVNISNAHSHFSDLAQLHITEGNVDPMLVKDIVYSKFLTSYIEDEMSLLITEVPDFFGREKKVIRMLMYYARNDPLAMFLLAIFFDSYEYAPKYFDFYHQKENIVQELLNRAIDLQFTQALTFQCLKQIEKVEKFDSSRLDGFEKAGALGDPRAYLYLAEYLYSKRGDHNYSDESIVNYYELAFNGGSIDAYYYLYLRETNNSNNNIFENSNDLILLIENAAKSGHSWSMNKYGEILINESQDFERAFSLFAKSSEMNNSEGMYLLGVLLSKKESRHYDPEKSFYWVKKSATFGSALGATLLSILYKNPNVLNSSIESEILSRYWHRIAVERGEKLEKLDKDLTATGWNFLMQNFSIKDRYRTYDYGHSGERSNVQVEQYEDIMADGMDAVIKLWIESAKPSPDKLNAYTKAYETQEIDYYAVTLNDRVETDIFLNKGDWFGVKTHGEILLSLNSSIQVDAGGTDALLLQSYNRVRELPHGCLLYRVGNSKWMKVGPYDNLFTVTESGNLEFGVNDKDSKNNRGYFDLRVNVFKD